MMKKLLLAAALAAVATPALSETPAPQPDADPAIWAVRDADTTIYLFGTFHLLDGRRDWFNDEVRTAFDRSHELVLEFADDLDPATIQPLVARYAVDPAGRTLPQRLPAPLAARLRGELAELGLPAGAFDQFEPWFVSMTLVALGAQRLGITGEQGTETVLTAAARARNMPIAGVETLESQMRMLDAVPEATQIEHLTQTVEGLDRLGETFRPMLDAWAAGDIDRIFEIVTAQTGTDTATYRTYLVDRNARWTDWVRARMDRPGTVFVAVGTAHLAGPDSVQALLARHGLRAERIAN
jgi:uncharacterized protein